MSDLEMTKACAEAIGLESDQTTEERERIGYWLTDGRLYDPFTFDAQAMALVKKLKLEIFLSTKDEGWYVMSNKVVDGAEIVATNHDLNRAIVECVAKLHLASDHPSR